jgi:glycolate oxidase FAD binding subunit
VRLGGDEIEGGANVFWRDIREHTAPFFAGDAPLWRLSLPSTAGRVDIDAPQLIEWGGALRWFRTALPAQEIRRLAHELGGHATLFRGGDKSQGTFTPLTPALAGIHQRLKAQFDPQRIFNPGRMFETL